MPAKHRSVPIFQGEAFLLCVPRNAIGSLRSILMKTARAVHGASHKTRLKRVDRDGSVTPDALLRTAEVQQASVLERDVTCRSVTPVNERQESCVKDPSEMIRAGPSNA